VALEVDEVAASGVIRAAEEVVEADFIERGGGGVGGDVAADAGGLLVRLADHRHGVPADDALDAVFDGDVAGIVRLEGLRDGVHVWGAGGDGERHAEALSGDLERLEEAGGAFWPAASTDIAQGVNPLLSFDPVWRFGRGSALCVVSHRFSVEGSCTRLVTVRYRYGNRRILAGVVW